MSERKHLKMFFWRKKKFVFPFLRHSTREKCAEFKENTIKSYIAQLDKKYNECLRRY
jgi:hypothetical protein